MFYLRSWGEAKNIYGVPHRLEIYQNDYLDPAIELRLLDVALHLDAGEEQFSSMAGQELQVIVRQQDGQELSWLFTNNPQGLLILFTENSQLVFKGWVVHDTFKQPYEDKADISFAAICGIGLLKTRLFFVNGFSQKYTGWMSAFDVLKQALKYIALDIDLVSFANLFETSMDESVEPLMQVGRNIDFVYALSENPTMVDVLDMFIKPFGQLRQRKGQWVFFPFDSYVRGLTGRRYDEDFDLVETNITPDFDVDFISAKDYYRENGMVFTSPPTLEVKPMAASVTVTQEASGSNNVFDAYSPWDKKNWTDAYSIIYPSLVLPRTTVKWIDLKSYDILTEEIADSYELARVAVMAFRVRQVAWNVKVTASVKFSYASFLPNTNQGVQLLISLSSINGTKWLTDDGWADEPTNGYKTLDFSSVTKLTEQSFTMSADGIPFNGTIMFQFRTNFYNQVNQVRIESMEFTIADAVDSTFVKKVDVIAGNQETEELTFKLLDLPDIYNAELFYKYYFTLADGTPTQAWRKAPSLQTRRLIEHIAEGVKSRRLNPTIKLDGAAFGPIDPMSLLTDVIGDGRSYMVTRLDRSYTNAENSSLTMLELPGYSPQGSSNNLQCENGLDLELENGEPLELETPGDEPTTDLELTATPTVGIRCAAVYGGYVMLGTLDGRLLAFNGTTIQEVANTYCTRVESLFVDSYNRLWVGCHHATMTFGLFYFTFTEGLVRIADVAAGNYIRQIGQLNAGIFVVFSKSPLVSSMAYVAHVISNSLTILASSNYGFIDYKSMQPNVFVQDGKLYFGLGWFLFVVSEVSAGEFTGLAYPTNPQMWYAITMFGSNRVIYNVDKVYMYAGLSLVNIISPSKGWLGYLFEIGSVLWFATDKQTYYFDGTVAMKLLQEFNTNGYDDGTSTDENYYTVIVGVYSINGDIYRINRRGVYKKVIP